MRRDQFVERVLFDIDQRSYLGGFRCVEFFVLICVYEVHVRAVRIKEIEDCTEAACFRLLGHRKSFSLGHCR